MCVYMCLSIRSRLCALQGVIGPGGVQWMTAGRGLVHSEMPVGVDGRLWGFQLWINLPKKHKMTKPRWVLYVYVCGLWFIFWGGGASSCGSICPSSTRLSFQGESLTSCVVCGVKEEGRRDFMLRGFPCGIKLPKQHNMTKSR